MNTDPKVQKLIDQAVKKERSRITANIRAAGVKLAADEAYCKNGKKGARDAVKAALAAAAAPAVADGNDAVH